jgi:drug/metabolite transporter (DMT)-like permease
MAALVLGLITLIAARVGRTGIALLTNAGTTGRQLALRQFWRQYLLSGVVGAALPFVLLASAELHLPASLATILNATSPIFGAAVAALWLRESLTGRKLAGLVLRLLGVSWGILFFGDSGSPSTLMGNTVILLGTALVTGLQLPRRQDAALRLGQ